MSENQSVIYLRDGALWWLDAGADLAQTLSDDAAAERLRGALTQRQHNVCFAVPGGELRLLELPVTNEERRHLDASLPFMLEESLTDNIEDLHFARQALSRDRYAVAVVRHSAMEGWQEALGEFGALVPWVPEPLLLPWTMGEWTLVMESQSVLLRFGQNEGARIEREMLPALLDAMARQSPPQRVVVYGSDEAADLAALDTLAGASLEWRRGGLGKAMLLNDQSAPRLNLLQGDYAPRLPYARWWSQWRSVAALLLIALTVHLLSGWLDYRRLERENLNLRTEIQSVYREVNPRGAVVDAETQLRRQLAALRGGGDGSSFTGMLAPLGDQLGNNAEMTLASLSYSQRSAELRVNLLAPGFAEVESLRTALLTAGFDATLESSARSGDKVRARLRIGERP